MTQEALFNVNDTVVIKHFDHTDSSFVGVIAEAHFAAPAWYYQIMADETKMHIRWESELLEDNNNDLMPEMLDRMVAL